ncbi:MAG: endopeptidase La, partial [Actinobacteria bacterium]
MADNKKVRATVLPQELPLIPLRNLVVFPHLVVPLFVGRAMSISALESSMKESHAIALVAQKGAEQENPKPKDLYKIGTIATVMQELKLPDGTAKALVEGVYRIKINNFSNKADPYYSISYEILEEPDLTGIEIEALMRQIVGQFEKCASLGKPIPQEALLAAMNIEHAGRLADYIAFHLNLKTEEKQAVLEAMKPDERLKIIGTYLERELKILEIGQKIQSRVKNQMDHTQREYLLREQLKAIQ